MSRVLREFERIYATPEFADQVTTYQDSFTKLTDRFLVFAQEYEPTGMLGYSELEETMLILSLAMVISPDLMTASHCNHRAVSSSIVQYYKMPFAPELQQQMTDYMAEEPLTRNRVVVGTESDTCIVSHTINNWIDTLPFLEDDLILNCKVTPGRPYELPREHLLQLPQNLEVHSISDVDNACPKRQFGTACHITHAERAAISYHEKLRKHFALPTPDNTILTCTWVPCADCLRLITDHKELYGNRLDVFSMYTADEDDNDSARKIKELQGNIGTFSGPFVKIPKVPGYGWLPGTSAVLEEVREKTKTIRSAEGKLLWNALSLLQD